MFTRKPLSSSIAAKFSALRYRSLMISSLLIGGHMIGASLVLAASPIPGTVIQNQATGTYVDTSNNSNQTVVSDIVSVSVAEVAGIQIVGASPSSPITGNVANFDFTITNIGNDPTKFFLPTAPSGMIGGTAGTLQVIGYIPAGGSQVTLSAIYITAAGDTGALTDPTLGGNTTLGSIPVGAAIVVRVPVTVTATGGNPVTVTLGNTGGQPSASNTPYVVGANGTGGQDVYTVDNADGAVTGEAADVPNNGDTSGHRQEASAVQTVNAIAADYGDAPDTGAGTATGNYRTTGIDGGPSHIIVSGLKLGTNLDGDSGGFQNNTATADDTNGTPDDEDAFTTLPNVSTSGTYRLSNIPVTNTVGNATLYAWVDFNKNGSFEASEYTSTNVANGTTSANLSWTVPAGTAAGSTFARFRLTTQVLTDNAGTANEDERSLGSASDGEVEDYQVAIAAPSSYDYGDAPDTYKTLIASGGPSHAISSLYLGAGVSVDTDGQPNATATGDTNDDGVTFSPAYGANYSTLVQEGVTNSVTVVSSGAGFLNAWIDYNQNGIFDAGELVFSNQPVVAGNNALAFTPSANLLHGKTFARFRLSPTSIASPSPIGAITGGEVEDYQVSVATPIPNGAACSATGLLNGSFESPALTAGTFSKPPKSSVLGWNTTATDQAIEIWTNGFNGVPSYSGNQFAEMNANQVASTYQDIATVPGTTLTYQFAHRGRRASSSVVVDTATISTGTPGGSLTQLRTFNTDTTDWVVYRGTYVVPANQYITRFQFNSISGGAGLSTFGNFIDGVQFSVDTCVTPISPPTIDLDGNDSTASGNDYKNTFSAGGAPVAAADTDVAIADDQTNITRAIIQLSNPLDGATESLTFDTALASSLGITVDLPYDSSTASPGNGQPNSTLGRLTLKGSSSLANYQTVLATLKYSNTKVSPTMTDRIINIQVIDSDRAISNTAVTTIKMSPAKANVLLVKRITAINGDRIKNPNDNTPLNVVVDDTLTNDNNANWPNPKTSGISNFLQGVTDAGKVIPGDTIEYTIYFLNADPGDSNGVGICDRITGLQSFNFDTYGPAGSGKDIQFHKGNGAFTTWPTTATTDLTSATDTVDRARLIATASAPTSCHLDMVTGGATDTGTLVVDVTGAATTNQPAWSPLSGSTGPGTANSYGYIRFTTKVNP